MIKPFSFSSLREPEKNKRLKTDNGRRIDYRVDVPYPDEDVPQQVESQPQPIELPPVPVFDNVILALKPQRIAKQEQAIQHMNKRIGHNRTIAALCLKGLCLKGKLSTNMREQFNRDAEWRQSILYSLCYNGYTSEVDDLLDEFVQKTFVSSPSYRTAVLYGLIGACIAENETATNLMLSYGADLQVPCEDHLRSKMISVPVATIVLSRDTRQLPLHLQTKETCCTSEIVPAFCIDYLNHHNLLKYNSYWLSWWTGKTFQNDDAQYLINAGVVPSAFGIETSRVSAQNYYYEKIANTLLMIPPLWILVVEYL